MRTTNKPVQPGIQTPEEIELSRKAKEYGLEFLSAVPDSYFDQSLTSKLPVEWARTNGLLPISINGETCVLTCNPDNISGQEFLTLLTGKELHPVVASREVVLTSIERCYVSRDESPDDFLKDMTDIRGDDKVEPKSDDILRIVEKAPVTQLVNLILLEAVKRRASDIHFEPFESRLRVRYRIDGVLYEQTSSPKHLEETLISRIKVMAKMDLGEKRLPQDGMAKVRIGEREIDIRVSTVPVAEGERVVLRLLDKDSSLIPLDVLGMSDSCMHQFNTLLKQPDGIIVVAGPTGSGKTTTLYAALSRLDSSRLNIMTIEDPIEYQLDNIGQIQVKPKIDLTFAVGLRHILRQDPDVILVGETRDVETAEIAMRASLTGHLVFTTLHTNDAAGAIIRLVDMGVESFLIAACLKGVLAQRLVRNLCPHCKRETTPTERQIAHLGSYGGLVKGRKIFQAGGCDKCLEGYRGRSGLFELITVDNDIRETIRRSHSEASQIIAAAQKTGMKTIMQDGIDKVLSGVTSLDEIISVLG